VSTLETLAFDNSYARLGDDFSVEVAPSPLPAPYRVSFNGRAAALLGLDASEGENPALLEYFSGARRLPGAEPRAAVYAGHQFGVYVPRLGDGRALLLGEVLNGAGERWELHLKGSGPTPFSRGGDGRAVLRSTLREYLGSEALHGLGVPTTRALCVIGSDAPVYREEVETGATLVRLSPSHVRFGTFEYFAHTHQPEQVARLLDHVLERHVPPAGETGPTRAGRTGAERALAFYEWVTERTAVLLAHWQAVGFAHGVMNTDNMSILGVTLDFGPYGFLDEYEPGFICNHSDERGRYAFEKQPRIAQWNLACLGGALLSQVSEAEAMPVLKTFQARYEAHFLSRMRAKLGLLEGRAGDEGLVRGLLSCMAESRVDYTAFFRALGGFSTEADARNAPLRDQFLDREGFDAWAQGYRARLISEGGNDAERKARMDRVNPAYVLRNYLAQQAIEKAQEKDFSEVDRLLELLADPFTERPGFERYAAPPPAWGRHLAVSCSS